MIFNISRVTSNYTGSKTYDKPPCEGCVRIPPLKDGRGDDCYKWQIEINSLDELMELADKNDGGLIVDTRYDDDGRHNTILIYDDYIE